MINKAIFFGYIYQISHIIYSVYINKKPSNKIINPNIDHFELENVQINHFHITNSIKMFKI